MRHINFDLVLSFDTDLERWRSEQLLLWKLMILTLRDYWFLKDHPEFPKLYDSGMVYLLPEQLERQPTRGQLRDFEEFMKSRMGMTADQIQHHLDFARGVEVFRDAPRMMEHGGGDCDNMAALRAAEVCAVGGNARPYLVGRQVGRRTIYHAKVLHKDGSDEDPSIILGMGGEERRAERREECRKNYERYDNLWQEAKQMIADEEPFPSDEARAARAAQLKEKIDSLGYLPKDGVFRVGPPRGAIVGHTGALIDCAARGRRAAKLPILGSWMALRAAA